MQALTAAQLTWLKRGGYIGIDITVDPVLGSNYNITEADIVDKTFSLDRSQWSTSQAIEIGNADAADLGFDLDNSYGQWNDKKLEGAILTVSFDIGGEALAAGIFTVDAQTKNYASMTITAMDNMSKFNKLYDGNLTYPATLLEIVQDACTDCSVTLHSTTFPNYTYSVTAEPTDAGITYHNLITWVAQIAGCNAWIDEDGELRITWYGGANTTEQFIIDSSMQFMDAEHDETELQLTGVRYVSEDTEYTSGTTDYAFVFSDNPLLQSDIQAALDVIKASVSLVKFMPFKNLPAIFLPNIWPGDVIIADAINFVSPDDGVEITKTTSNADMAAITNGAGLDGADISARNYKKVAVLIGRHTLDTSSKMVGVGESATVLARNNGSALSDAQRNAVKAIATNKIETLAIERSLTVGGKAVQVKIDTTVGIEITVDGVKMFGVNSSGQIYAQSLSNLTDGSYYMTYGYGGSPGIECFMPTLGKFLGISPTVTGGFQFYDLNTNLRMGFNVNGSITAYDASGHLVLTIDSTSNYAQLHIPSATDNAIGVDATGAYKITGGSKTYL